MYNPDKVRKYYNDYGEKEWERLAYNPHGIVQFQVTSHFLEKYLPKNAYVLDAGGGPGRYAIKIAEMGGRVYLSDISNEQLKLGKKKIIEAGVQDQVTEIRRHDICDLSEIPDHSFNMVICLGGALSYVREQHTQAIKELIRVVKPGSPLIISVMSLLGTFHLIAPLDGVAFLENITQHIEWDPSDPFPDYLNSTPGSNEWHAPMTLYSSKYLKKILEQQGCKVLELASTNTITSGFHPMEKISKSPQALEMLVRLEKEFCSKPGLIDMGQHILAVARTPS